MKLVQYSTLVLCGLCAPALAAESITVSGRYYRHTDAETRELMGDQVCFSPDDASKQLLPPPPGIQSLWFCFNDTDAAARAFQLPAKAADGICEYAGLAKIRITNYQAYQGESDADWNKATPHEGA